MKKYLLFLFLISITKFSTAQVLCIYCYDQNDTISANVNNLILNGGFENTTCIPNNWFSSSYVPNSAYYNCDITNWTCTGGGPSTYADVTDINYAQVVEGSVAVYFGNDFCITCSSQSNDTSCFITTGCTLTGIPSGYPTHANTGYGDTLGVSLAQTITGLTIGNIYVLEFWAGGEFHGSFFSNGLFAVDVGFGDTLMRNKPTDYVTGIGTRFIIEFAAISTSHTIKFTNWGHICSDCTELILDDVRLYTLAELDASVPHCTVGIDNPNFQGADYLISPNPFTNEINIKTNSSELSEIIFYDIASRKLLQQTFFNSAIINTTQLSKGIYFYEVKNKNGVVRKGKVVKE